MVITVVRTVLLDVALAPGRDRLSRTNNQWDEPILKLVYRLSLHILIALDVRRFVLQIVHIGVHVVNKLAVGVVVIVKIFVVNHQNEIQLDLALDLHLNSLIGRSIVGDLAGQIYFILRAEVINEDHVHDEEDQERVHYERAGASQEGLVVSFTVL